MGRYASGELAGAAGPGAGICGDRGTPTPGAPGREAGIERGRGLPGGGVKRRGAAGPGHVAVRIIGLGDRGGTGRAGFGFVIVVVVVVIIAAPFGQQGQNN